MYYFQSQHGDNEKLMNLSKSPSPVSLRSDSILSGHSCSDRNEKMSVDVEIAFTRYGFRLEINVNKKPETMRCLSFY